MSGAKLGKQARLTTGLNCTSSATLRLSDRLLDLDRPVRVTVNGSVVFAGKVPRTARAIWQSLEERPDPASAETALLTLAGTERPDR